MGDKNGGRIDHGKSLEFSFFLLDPGDPCGRQLIDRFGGLDAIKNLLAVRCIHGKPAVSMNLPSSVFFAFEQQAVFLPLKLQIVFDFDGWDDHPHFTGKIFPDSGDPREQVAFFTLIGQMHQGIAQFDLKGIEFEKLFHGYLSLGLFAS